MNSNTIFSKEHVFSVDEFPDGEIIIYTNDEKVHVLNSTAATIYSLIDGLKNVQRIEELFISMYDIEFHYDLKIYQAEIEDCITQMLERGLICEIKV